MEVNNLLENRKRHYNMWSAYANNQKEALNYAIDRFLYHVEMRRKMSNPESDDYMYVDGLVEMWNYRITAIRRNYVTALQEVDIYDGLISE